MHNLSQDNINQLQTAIRGQVILPDAQGYEESRSIWNGMIDRKPSAVLRLTLPAAMIFHLRFGEVVIILPVWRWLMTP